MSLDVLCFVSLPIMTDTNEPRVAILCGSASDWPIVEHAARTLDDLGVGWDARALSAHRTPDEVVDFVEAAPARGIRVFIAAAGGAAHLAGVISSKTLLPVIGIPMPGWSMGGLDALLSTAQMPGGVPVATVAIGKAGAVNAGLLAVAILSLSDGALAERYRAWRARQSENVRKQAPLVLSRTDS